MVIFWLAVTVESVFDVAVTITVVAAETDGGARYVARKGLEVKVKSVPTEAGEMLQVTAEFLLSFETSEFRNRTSFGLRVKGASGDPVPKFCSEIVIGEKRNVTDAETFGLVIDVAVTVTLVGLASTEGGVYLTVAVSVEASNVELLNPPKLTGEADQTTPWLFWS